MFEADGILKRIYNAKPLDLKDLERILSWEREEELGCLFSFADKVRKEYCGDGIVLRGIIEFSSFCSRDCFYCGLNINNQKLERYRMSKDELLKAVEYLAAANIKTVILQSGEDPSLDAEWLKDVIENIKLKFDIAITLSVGERSSEDYRLWRQAGADRYLLKMETSSKDLYLSAHAQMSFDQRLSCLNVLGELGYQVGTGNIIGLPGQSLMDIARDILFFKQGCFDMIGIGPFIPHKDSWFRAEKKGDWLLTLKTIALTRIVTRNAHIPATTALGSLDKDYRSDGLKCGANVLMPNFTPLPYRKRYEIYPGKRCIDEPVGACNFCLEDLAKSLGRFVDYSKAHSFKQKEAILHV